MAGGLEDVVQEQHVEQVFTFGEKVLHWIEDPAHWIPALLIILGIAVWRGSVSFGRKT